MGSDCHVRANDQVTNRQGVRKRADKLTGHSLHLDRKCLSTGSAASGPARSAIVLHKTGIRRTRRTWCLRAAEMTDYVDSDPSLARSLWYQKERARRTAARRTKEKIR